MPPERSYSLHGALSVIENRFRRWQLLVSAFVLDGPADREFLRLRDARIVCANPP